MCILVTEEVNPIPQPVKKLSDNTISLVFLGADNKIYKRSTPFLTANELWCLQAMAGSGYTPHAYYHDAYTLKMEYLGPGEGVRRAGDFQAHLGGILVALQEAGIRHGDLTPPNLVVRRDHPYLLDFAESRLLTDPRPAKRPESDATQLARTLALLAGGV